MSDATMEHDERSSAAAPDGVRVEAGAATYAGAIYRLIPARPAAAADPVADPA